MSAEIRVGRARGGNRWRWALVVGSDVEVVASVATFPTQDKARRDAEAAKRAMVVAAVVIRE